MQPSAAEAMKCLDGDGVGIGDWCEPELCCMLVSWKALGRYAQGQRIEALRFARDFNVRRLSRRILVANQFDVHLLSPTSTVTGNGSLMDGKMLGSKIHKMLPALRSPAAG